MLITSAEREVKHSRRSGMSQSCFFGDKIGHARSIGFIRLFDEVRAELVEISRDHFDFFDLFFNLFEEERNFQPRSQSSSAISGVTSPVKLVGKIRQGRQANNGKSKMATPT